MSEEKERSFARDKTMFLERKYNQRKVQHSSQSIYQVRLIMQTTKEFRSRLFKYYILTLLVLNLLLRTPVAK